MNNKDFVIRSITTLPKPDKCLVYTIANYMYIPDYILAIAYEVNGESHIGIMPEEFIACEEPLDISQTTFGGYEILKDGDFVSNYIIISFVEEQGKSIIIEEAINDAKEILRKSGLHYNSDFNNVFTKQDFEHYKNKYK